MNLDEALQTFIVESRELLQDLEQALLRMEDEAPTADTINAMFRAAHTIKGSAGLFGLDDIVSFTHGVESVLDRVRGGELLLDGELASLFLSCCDHMGALVDQVVSGSDGDAELAAAGNALTARLKAYLGGPEAQPQPQAKVPQQREQKLEASGGGEVETDSWHISLRFGRDVLRNGMDPLSFIRYLGTLGKVVSLSTLTEAIPAAAEMDPESCYLGFEIRFKSDADKAAIEGVFEFVREDSEIHILSPRAKISEYVELIRALPEEDLRLGEILVKCGSLTPAELEQALRLQSGAPPGAGEAGGRQIGDILVDEGVVHPPVVEAALAKQKQTKDSKASEGQFIRVDAEKLDHLINLVGEMVIAGAGANLAAQRAGAAELLEATSTLSRLVEEVRDSALQLRMVQIAATFNRFQRVVRDVSRELGKDIGLSISGGETELDKTVVEKIGDPLMHLVRNSMDHGIEPSDVRVSRGKPAKGTVSLNAYHDSGGIVIEVADDGGGLKREKILQKALEKGLVAPGQSLTDREIHQLILEPGFSTAEQVTNLSGRGVGMDVVKRNITALRGTIDLDSEEGVGMTIRIRLPLTLAIIDGFLVGVCDSSFVVPLDMVVECVELTEAERRAARDNSYINLRGEVLPFLRLRELFELPGQPGRRENIVVVRYGGQKAGLVVDRLMGEFQTVIKPLGALFSNIRGIGGSTILGSGEVALILDVPGLLQQVVSREAHSKAPAGGGLVHAKG